MTLAERLTALSSVATLGAGRLPEDVLAEVRALDARAGTRLRLSGEHTVVALAGATGSGKSSLFNAIAGAPLAQVGIRRPTTSATQAVVFGPSPATELLDWLEIRNRQAGDASATPQLSGLLLLDLPDHDSIEAAHRAEVDRLIRLVDAFVWVLDPQKYADAVLHDEYLRPLAPHREVMVVVLNQVDRLSLPDVASCMHDLHRLLAADGLTGVPVLATSAVKPDGASELQEFLVSTVADHRVRTARLSADLDAMAATLTPLAPGRRSDPALRETERHLRGALAGAAAVPTVVDAVVRAYTRRGLAATGWPPVRWISKVRPDPLRRLGLGASDAHGEILRRTSMPSGSAASRAGVDTAVRALADTASDGLPAPWPRIMREAARSHAEAVPDALDRAVGGADLGMARRPRWWRLFEVLQWLLIAVAVAGGVWLGALAVLAYLQIDLDAPDLGPFALPTVLLLGGLVLGLLLRIVVRPFVALGAARRRRRVTAYLHGRIGDVADGLVLAPLRNELALYGQLSAAVHLVGR
jgi:energy-coupling factor transporter ATP-binding protein EcfA2